MRTRSILKRFLFLALLCCPGLAVASRARTINLEEMTARADRVVLARVAEIRVGTDRDLGQTVTWVRLVPERTAKGKIAGSFTIKLLGDQRSDAPVGGAVEGLPRFNVRERVVLFLHPDSRRGLTSPVGFGQGAFRISRDRAGNDEATNAVGNRQLLDGLSLPVRQRLGTRLADYRGRGAIPADALLDLVLSFDAAP